MVSARFRSLAGASANVPVLNRGRGWCYESRIAIAAITIDATATTTAAMNQFRRMLGRV
jgi:hypothetical protein